MSSVRELILKSSFSAQKWERLQHESLFRAAARSMKTMEDVEKVVRLGERLIELGQRADATKVPTPKSPRLRRAADHQQ